jgi:hypothetical protein
MGILENIKDAADLAKKVGDIELYRKIVHLEGEVMDLTRERRQAEQKIEELEKKLAVKAEMTFEVPFYYRKGDEAPFCPRCFEKDTQAVHVILQFNNEERTRWNCPDCKQSYVIEKGIKRPHNVQGYGRWS